MQVMQGSDLGWLLVIVAVAGFLAGRAQLGRQAWRKRRLGEPQTWRDGRWKGRWETPQTWRKRPWGRGEAEFPKTGAVPVTDPAEQLRLVMGARFEKRSLLSRSEAYVLYAAENAIKTADLQWRVMAQVSLGEILSSPDGRAYSAINSKRVDLLIVSRSGDPIAAIEYQGHGHYQGTAAARDAVKKEALRKAGVRYIEVTPESGTEDMARVISRIAQAVASPTVP